MFQLQPLSGGGLKDEYTLYAKAWFTFDWESCIFYVSLRSEREGRVLRWGHKKPDLLLGELDTGHTPILSLLGLTAVLLLSLYWSTEQNNDIYCWHRGGHSAWFGHSRTLVCSRHQCPQLHKAQQTTATVSIFRHHSCGSQWGSRPRLQILSEPHLPSAQHMEEVLLYLACSSAKGGGPTFPMARGGVPCPCLQDVLAGGVSQG